MIKLLLEILLPITFSWQPATQGGLASGFELGVGDAPGIYTSYIDTKYPPSDSNGAKSYRLPVWNTNVPRYVAVRAYNSEGKSPWSPEIVVGKAPVDIYFAPWCMQREVICTLLRKKKCPYKFEPICKPIVSKPLP